MSTIATAYVQILPSTKGMKSNLTSEMSGDIESAGREAGNSFGSSLVSTATKLIAAAGIGSALKSALDEGAALQQSMGGVETIYGDAADQMKKYAKEAQSAGLSMNDFMETSVSMGAALKNSLGGDTAAAAEKANTAIMDMTDNAAKMGTDVESLKNAYVGFSRGNFTMLDNLSLGFAGTKEGMQQLLEKAKELSGVDYDIESYGDIVDAIHVVQQEMGIAGVAAAEGAETFSGSFDAMKAAASNFMGALALGDGVPEAMNTLIGSVSTFFFKNFMPMLGTILQNVPSAFVQAFGNIGTYIEDWIKSTGANDLNTRIHQLLTSAFAFVKMDLPTMISDLIGTISDLLNGVIETITTGLPQMLDNVKSFFGLFVESVAEFASQLIPAGVEFINNLITGIFEALPDLISTASEMMLNLVNTVLDLIPDIMQAGKDIFLNFADGFKENFPDMMSNLGEHLASLLSTIVDHLPEFAKGAADLIVSMITGLVEMAPALLEGFWNLLVSLGDAVTEVDWLQLGTDIVNGIIEGVSNAAGALWDAMCDLAGSALDAAKDFLGIGSPSKVFRDEVGKWLDYGIVEGVNVNADAVTDSVEDLSYGALNGAKGVLNTANRITSMTPNLEQNNTEGRIDQIISLLGTLIDNQSSMGVYIDGGALVGQISGDIDRTLGRLASQKGRYAI